MGVQTQTSLQIAFPRNGKCGNCCAADDNLQRCNSCCNFVCSICMMKEDPCCLGCQELFPVASPTHTPGTNSFEVDSTSSDSDSCVQYQMIFVPAEQQGVFTGQNMHSQGFQNAKCDDFLRGDVHGENGPSTVFSAEETREMWLAAQAAEFERQAEILMAEARYARLSAAALQAAQQVKPRSGVEKSNKQTEKTSKQAKSQHRQVETDAEARTMMICDIPCRISRDVLIEAIDSFGFSGTYDFVHLPCRYGHENTNIGYGFVNFFNADDATAFAMAFQGFRFHGYKSTKTCTVKIAKQQGFNANLHPMRHRKKLAAFAN